MGEEHGKEKRIYEDRDSSRCVEETGGDWIGWERVKGGALDGKCEGRAESGRELTRPSEQRPGHGSSRMPGRTGQKEKG